MKKILVLAQDPREGDEIALRLTRGGYSAQTVRPENRELPAPGGARPDLVIVYFSSETQWALDLARAPEGISNVPILVVSALGHSRLEGPLRVLPIVSCVLFRPYSAANFLSAVRGGLALAATLGSPLAMDSHVDRLLAVPR